MKIKGDEIFFVDNTNNQDKLLLYAPLRSYLAVIDKSVKTKLENNDKSATQELLKIFKGKKKIDINQALKEIQGSTPELALSLTDNCNLKCLYCHASAGDSHKTGEMSKEIVLSVVKQYFDQLPKNTDKVVINIAGGGEPTYNYPLFKYTVELCKEFAKKKNIKNVSFRLATNGFYKDNVRQYLLENFDNISLSFDGIESIQNLHRPTKNDKGSFKTVFETAKFFYKNKAKMAFRVTVSDFSLNKLKLITDFFCEHFPNMSVGIEALTPNGRAEKCEIITQPNKKVFAKKLLELFEYSKDKPIRFNNSASSEFNNIRPVFCSSVGIPNWTVSVDGNIYACTRDDMPDVFRFGKFDFEKEKVILEKEKIDVIRKMSVVNYPECQDCFCKYHCAGDCPDRRLTDKLDCDSIREIGTYFLNNKIYN